MPVPPPAQQRVNSALLGLCFLAALGPGNRARADDQADIARKLNNPIANLISVPFQANYNQDIGPNKDGEQYLLNIQPVIPVSLNDSWNVISRTILPVIQLNDVPPGNDESGIGDVLQSFFFSPKAAGPGGWIWGVGPALWLDTASDDLLGANKWAAGPTAVALKQKDGWTYGALANQLWSYAGDGDAEDVSAVYIQPFLYYTTATYTTFGINTESTYNFKGDDWSVAINISVIQLLRIGGQPMSIQVGARYWAESPDGAAEGWGARPAYTLVFPR